MRSTDKSARTGECTAAVARVKPDAVLINTSRGPIVDEAALIEVLQQHRILGAALDVYDAEPLAADHPLRHTDNTLLLAHRGWPTDDGYSSNDPRNSACDRSVSGRIADRTVENPAEAATR